MNITTGNIEHVKSQVLKCLSEGTKWEDKEAYFPPDKIIPAILEIAGVAKDEDSDPDSNEGFSTNGWDYDWWQSFIYNEKSYILSGSGYYGGHSFEADEPS